jgi:hypothetical protein
MCDRCGFIYSHSDLQFQMDYAGAGLINKQMLVCNSCLDVAQEQLRVIVIPADPTPIQNPRPADFAAQRTDKRITIGPIETDPRTSLQTRTGDTRTTEDKNARIVQKNGDAMLAPKLVRRVRTTNLRDRRIIENEARLRGEASPGVRVTELMSPVEPPPAPPAPGPEVSGIRIVDTGGLRITRDKRVRLITKGEFVVEGRQTSNGDFRITQTNELRGSLVRPSILVVEGRQTDDGNERVTQKNELRGALVVASSKRKKDG